jgi:hypothetical protein
MFFLVFDVLIFVVVTCPRLIIVISNSSAQSDPINWLPQFAKTLFLDLYCNDKIRRTHFVGVYKLNRKTFKKTFEK